MPNNEALRVVTSGPGRLAMPARPGPCHLHYTSISKFLQHILQRNGPVVGMLYTDALVALIVRSVFRQHTSVVRVPMNVPFVPIKMSRMDRDVTQDEGIQLVDTPDVIESEWPEVILGFENIVVPPDQHFPSIEALQAAKSTAWYRYIAQVINLVSG